MFYLSAPAYKSAQTIAICVCTSITLIFSIYFLFMASTTSPGYIPKSDLSQEDYLANPQIKVVKGLEIELKYCETCKNVRGPRTFHCNICGNCIEKHGIILTKIIIVLGLGIVLEVKILKFFINF